jgi:hypothetical protein
MTKRALTPFLSVLLVAGCTKILPPLAAPDPRLPVVTIDPPPHEAGLGYVSIDVTEGTAEIYEVLDTFTGAASGGGVTVSSYGESKRKLCVTPCVLSMTYGPHQLRAVSREEKGRVTEEMITIGQKPLAVRIAMGLDKAPPIGGFVGAILGVSFGSGFLLPGLILLPLDSGGAGAVLSVTGAAMLIPSLFILKARPFIRQKGAVAQWTPQDGAIFLRPEALGEVR